MPNANEPLKDVELAVSELVDSYRNKAPRAKVIHALREQWGLLSADHGWQDPVEEPQDPEQDLVEEPQDPEPEPPEGAPV